MAHWRDHEPVFVSEIQTVQAVDELCAVRHVKFAGMPVKNVQGHAAEHGIPQRGSLFENVPWRRLAPGTVPRAPFIHDDLDAVLPVEFTHDLPIPYKHAFPT